MTISDPLRAFAEKLPFGWQLKSFEAMLAEPVRNGIYKTKEFHGRGARVVNMGELFSFDFISGQEMKRVELTPDEENKTGLVDGDLLFARRSLVLEGAGKCALVVNPPDTMTFESSIIRARPNRRVAEPRFLFYLFASPLGRAIIASIATRTAVSGIRGSDLSQVGLPLPPLSVQRRIAGILSAYDELIENNQRRIKILESMARALYCEWFVHFRFPGHEKVPLVASPLGEIPQGWEVKRLDEVLELKYGKALKKEDRRDGPFPVYGSSGMVGTHESSLVKGPGIIVGRKGNVGSIFWCNDDFFVIDTAYFVTSSLPLRFLFYVLPTLNFINSDAAVPGLSRNQAYTLEILVPPTKLLTMFCELVNTFEGKPPHSNAKSKTSAGRATCYCRVCCRGKLHSTERQHEFHRQPVFRC
ncbi:type I restriction enzyme, S subunit [Gammaproteobacteria bacterium]